MGNRACQSAEYIVAKDTEREALHSQRVDLAIAIAKSRPMSRRVAKLIAAVRGERIAPPGPSTTGAIRSEQVRVKRARIAEITACESCRFVMPSPSLMNLHHIKPVALGGDNSPENVAILCPNCHASAHWHMRSKIIEGRADLFRVLRSPRAA